MMTSKNSNRSINDDNDSYYYSYSCTKSPLPLETTATIEASDAIVPHVSAQQHNEFSENKNPIRTSSTSVVVLHRKAPTTTPRPPPSFLTSSHMNTSNNEGRMKLPLKSAATAAEARIAKLRQQRVWQHRVVFAALNNSTANDENKPAPLHPTSLSNEITKESAKPSTVAATHNIVPVGASITTTAPITTVSTLTAIPTNTAPAAFIFGTPTNDTSAPATATTNITPSASNTAGFVFGGTTAASINFNNSNSATAPTTSSRRLRALNARSRRK